MKQHEIIPKNNKTPVVPSTAPRNFVAKNAKGSGAGAHADKKKEAKRGIEKHKKDFSTMDESADQGLAEGDIVQFPQKHPWYAAKTCPQCEGSLVGGKTADGRVKYCMGCGAVYPEPNTNKGVAEGKSPIYVGRETKEGTWHVFASGSDTFPLPAAGPFKSSTEAAAWIKQQAPKRSLNEYGDTPKGQKMLTKIQQRAVDRVLSKRADTDPAYAKKNQQTADRAWERFSESLDEATADKKSITKIASLEKKIKDAQDALGLARERRKMKGQRQQGAREIALNSKMNDLRQQIDTIKREAVQTNESVELDDASDNPVDVVTLDVPLLIRIMEYAREDAKTDMDLHVLAEKMIELCTTAQHLTMQDYDAIIQQEPDGSNDTESMNISESIAMNKLLLNAGLNKNK